MQMPIRNRDTLFNIRTYGLIVVYIVLLLISGIYDLQISQSIANQYAGWAKVIEGYGELPGIITLLTAIFIYHQKKRHSSNSRTILYGSILLYSAFMLFTYAGYLLLKPFISSSYWVLIFGLVLTLISFLLNKKLKINFSENAFVFSKISLLMGIFGYVLFVQPLKVFWGRIRFRDLDALYSNFTPWFLPNGITGNDSFPSGHSAMGFVLISFFVLFKDKGWIKRYGAYVFILMWAFAVASSRVIIGAHFLSDVVVGSAGIIFSYLYFTQKDRTKNI